MVTAELANGRLCHSRRSSTNALLRAGFDSRARQIVIRADPAAESRPSSLTGSSHSDRRNASGRLRPTHPSRQVKGRQDTVTSRKMALILVMDKAPPGRQQRVSRRSARPSWASGPPRLADPRRRRQGQEHRAEIRSAVEHGPDSSAAERPALRCGQDSVAMHPVIELV